MCLITLLSCYAKLKKIGLWFLSYEIFVHNRQNLCHYVCLLDSSYAYDCTLLPMATPLLNHIPFLSWIEFILVCPHCLVLTFAIISRWTTLNLRQLMWKHALS
jgi:hypothetical protein